MSFLIYALPRSRTAWLARFLTYRDWSCGHEQAIFLRSPKEARRLLHKPCRGTVETAAGPAWRLIRHWAPELRVAVLRRPIEETVAAMIAAGERAGARYNEDKLHRAMSYGSRCMEAVSALPGALTIDYAELTTEEGCRRVFEHCLPYPFDREWWLALKDRHIEVDLPLYFQYYRSNRDGIEEFKSMCKRELIRLARRGELNRAVY